MNLIEWNEKFSVRNTGLDKEHKKLFSLINKLNDAVSEKKDRSLCNEILFSLLEYTEYHFSNEEGLLKEYGYSQLDQHVKAHNVLIGRVKKLREQSAKGEPLTGEMLRFLEEWICQHILVVDRHYSEELAVYLRAE